MIEQLPHLTQIKLRCVSDFINVGQAISYIIQCCTKLEVLSIGVPKLSELKHSFIYEMAEATQHNPKMKMKLLKVDCSLEKALTAYRGTVRRGYAILYWNDYDHIHSKTSTGLLDLNEKCTQKIIQLISTSLNDLAALFNTCKRTQQAVKDYLSENAVRASIVPAALDKNVLECLGEHILRAELSRGCDLPLQSQNDFDDDYMDELYNEACKFRQDLNRYCLNLTELTVDVFDDDDLLDEFDHPWPNLTKIKLSYCYDDGYQNLQQFTSPKLAYNAVL
ncbi:uncharacterized protein LOC129565259 [Sitodiplosis mosellana]|uniref:uncharacterized protein LOC129565259 n=1 Tax=Sitodiplosis mosellana TaxID=263140 RepID=UPI0024451476|nr:uncharacterized protein LOC129565259 [Sitodiplosis mosellana]